VGGQKNSGGQNVGFQAKNTILFGIPLLKVQNDYELQKLVEGAWPLWPSLATHMPSGFVINVDRLKQHKQC